jgi:NAD(P)-dependent dehydrogenase (short-subunit alcohol dehydrogenase family)
MSEVKVAVVTGGNRGLGFETCRQLARLGFRVVLTSRDPRQGDASTETLRGEGLDVVFHPLEVTHPESAGALARFIESREGRLDVLINNAGAALDAQVPGGRRVAGVLEAAPESLRRSFETNCLGALHVSQALVPLMRRRGSGRVVNVSSGKGALSDMGSGWPGYRLSKAALNAFTRILAEELKGTRIKVNAVCPGWARTGMGGPQAPRSPEEGVETIVWLATLPDDGPTGGFFRDRRPIPW